MFLDHVHRLALCCGAALILTSCTVGPDFNRPQSPATTSYTAGGDHLALGDREVLRGQAPEPQWWQVFRSSNLDRVMTRALQDNNTLAEAQASLARSREQLQAVSGKAFWPELNLAGSAGRQKFGVAELGPGEVSVPAFTAYTLGPKISYLLDFAGGERRSVEQQAAVAESKQCRFAATRLALSGEVIDQALAVAAAREQLTVLAGVVADDGENVALVEIAVKAGAATQIDLLSARSQLAGDEALVPPLKQQLSVANHALALLIGQTPADWQPPQFTLGDFTLPQTLPLRLPSEMVRVRPDIRAAEAELHAATAAIGVAEARLYPSLILSADTLQESLTTGSLFDGANNTFAFGAQLSAPIFNGGSLRAEKRAAEQAYRAALARYRQVVLSAFVQVADVLKALEHDGEEVTAQQHALETAKESLRLARLSYSAGGSGVLQVLDAERLSNQARLGYARAKVRRLQDTALLYLALGGGHTAATAN